MKILNNLYQAISANRHKSNYNSNIVKTIEYIEKEYLNKVHSVLFDLKEQVPEIKSNFSGFLIKPVSDRCNLGCSYCYESPNSYEASTEKLDVLNLEKIIIQILENSGEFANFYWHGGEPLLAGLEYYKKAVSIQSKLKMDKKIINAIQTNGVLLNNEWLDFFQENNFKISLSFDGPKEIHDSRRFYKNQKGSYEDVVKVFLQLSERNIPIHVITVAHESLKDNYEAYYNEIKKWNIKTFDIHPNFQNHKNYIDPVIFSEIIISIFNLWNDDHEYRTFVPVKDFIASMVKGQPETCYHAGKCSSILAIDGNGDFLSCTRPFNKKMYTFGNLKTNYNLTTVKSNKNFITFQENDNIAINQTKNCKWGKICNNGCPQHRVKNSKNLVDGNSVFCTCHSNSVGGYYAIWDHFFNYLNNKFTSEISKSF
ncbi:radical SAM protein [Flavobacterium sp. WC2429]|jgi:uncharacterized protein|uniref:Radical SAM protein n=1 Tax=Flavobacterium sp. WC2429 TaxID=3234140 RepID=A0AB39WKF1_9FLAO